MDARARERGSPDSYAERRADQDAARLRWTDARILEATGKPPAMSCVLDGGDVILRPDGARDLDRLQPRRRHRKVQFLGFDLLNWTEWMCARGCSIGAKLRSQG